MHKGREASFAFCLMILRLKIPNTLSGPRWIQVGYKNSRFSTNISLHHGNGIEDKHELLIGRLISMILNELKRPYPDIYFPDKREIWHGSLLPPPCQILLPRAKFHVYRGRNVRIAPKTGKISNFGHTFAPQGRLVCTIFYEILSLCTRL